MIKIKLSKILGDKRITQSELVKKTGIRPGTINELYHDISTRVNLEHLDKICEALDCDLFELLEYSKNKNKTTGKSLILEQHGNRKNTLV